jgi:hypothetical protein
MTRCGYPRCRCPADPPLLHGPCHQWTRKINGKTVTRILTDDQMADYKPWFDNQRRLRELDRRAGTLSQEITDNDPRWNRRDPGRRGFNALNLQANRLPVPIGPGHP